MIAPDNNDSPELTLLKKIDSSITGIDRRLNGIESQIADVERRAIKYGAAAGAGTGAVAGTLAGTIVSLGVQFARAKLGL